MAVIGCDIPVRQVVGADRLAQAKAGLWTKTRFYQEGNYLCAKTFLVAAGEPSVLEFRIDLRPLEKVAARIHQRLHERMMQRGTGEQGAWGRSGSGSGPNTQTPNYPVPGGSAAVGFSFAKAYRSIKSTAKKIGKSKLIKAVGGAIKSVAKSKLVGSVLAVTAVAVPGVGIAALAAYGAANAAIKAVDKGKKLVSTANQARRTLTAAASATQKISAAKRQAPGKVQAVQAQAKARASSLAAQALSKASAQSSVAASNAVRAAAAAKAKATLAQGKAQATAAAKSIVAQVKAAETKIAPVVRAAATLRDKLSDPAVRAKLATIQRQADSARDVLSEIKENAAHGSGAQKLDAQKSAAIVNLVAKNEARIQAMSQVNAGGLPSLLIDSKGRIVPGKFRIVARSGGKNPDVLYRGPKATTERGAFARVSGEGPGATPKIADWWTISVQPKKSNRWISLQPNGILFREHWQASKAVQWYEGRGIPAKATIAKYTPTPAELKKSQSRIGGQPHVGAAAHPVTQRPMTCFTDRPGGVSRTGIRAHVPGQLASPFPPATPRDRVEKSAAYADWLRTHAPRTKVGYEDDPEIGCDEAEVSGQNWKSDGRPPRPGDLVLFAHEGKFLHGRATHVSKPGHWSIRATPKSGGRIHTVVPERNIIAHDATDRAKRERWNVGGTPFVGYSPSPAWATTIGCPCSDQGTQF